MKIQNRKLKTSLVLLFLSSSFCFGLRADCNLDGQVNILDLAILAEEWLMSDVLMITASEGATPDGVAAVGLIESGNRYYTYRPNGEGTYPFWSLSWSTSPGPRWILRYYPEEGVSALWVRADASPFGDYVANSGATGTVTISIPVYVEALKCHLIGDGAVLVNQNMLGGGPMLNDKKSLISE